ncbi:MULTISPECIES: BCD family MFS transporter [Cyanophyceae]|uniref:BCD family MFS transporter n=1 Tax=Cyanophyceae TaxID=3028117 RepID=UPI0016849DB6|nr:BCD family MFS transporter [Trichocoleus sp. FACHB-69]MBD1934558.1 BCD family MFS transporter [Trichocoleus sp. FACHB-69]
MATGDINLQPDESKPLESIKKVNLFTMFRLGLFQMGLGMMAVLALGILNRVMIGELGIPATIAAGTIAMHQFIAPARVWFGQMSDSKPLFGFHRTGYVWVGAALFAIASFLAVQVMWQLGNVVQAAGGWVWTTQTYGWTAVLALIFALYGLALSMSSTPFAALLVDVSDEDNRSKLVGIVWSMLMVGIVLGAIIGGTLLKKVAADAPLSELQASVNQLFMIVPVAVFGLALLATVGVEKKYSRYTSRSTLVDREDKITLGKALRVLTANRQTGIFFTFLLVMTISLFMQEAVMEPYGGEVFGMQVSETTKLNAYWGTGTLLGISITGFLIVPRLGKQKTTKLGCLLVAATFGLIILSGFTHNQKLLQGALLLFGLASGVTTTGAVSLMLDLTAAETAGTFIGAWGLSQAMARAIATVTGGAVLDVGKSLFTTNLVLAYGLVFALQAVGMVVAVVFLSHVDVTEFRDNAKVAIATVLEGELD